MLTIDRHKTSSQNRPQNRGEVHTVSRLEFDRTDPLRAAPGALPTPHPASPIANSPIFSDPKVLETLLIDYLAGYTASRLCSSYNITLPQLFAWRRHPEIRKLLEEHEEFAAAQARHVQHDKEPEIILTLCAIATRGSSESECRRAASDLLRTFKCREYLLQRSQRGSPSDQPPANEPPSNKSRSTNSTVRAPSPASDCTPPAPSSRSKTPSNLSPTSHAAPTPNLAGSPDTNREPVQDSTQDPIEIQPPAPESKNQTAIDSRTKFENLDRLTARPDPRDADLASADPEEDLDEDECEVEREEVASPKDNHPEVDQPDDHQPESESPTIPKAAIKEPTVSPSLAESPASEPRISEYRDLRREYSCPVCEHPNSS